MVVRLAENGCLLNELRKRRENPYYNVTKKNEHFSLYDKTSIERDVANGMLHLSNKKVNMHVIKCIILVFHSVTVLLSKITECQLLRFRDNLFPVCELFHFDVGISLQPSERKMSKILSKLLSAAYPAIRVSSIFLATNVRKRKKLCTRHREYV